MTTFILPRVENTHINNYGVFFFRTTQELEFFISSEFNIRLYDKNSESDYFFFLHQNQNIFSATLGIRIFF
jgi:hypothetical protein